MNASEVVKRVTKRPKLMSSPTEDEISVREEDRSRLVELEEQLKNNSNLYDVHVEYVELCRCSGLVEKVKKGRREFQKRFPLPEKMWLEWIADEEIEELYALAVDDYLSIEIWKKYLEFLNKHIMEKKLKKEKLKKWRDVAENALEICGMHFSRGVEIWSIVIDFEKSLLSSQQLHADDEEKEDQIERIRQLYFRVLQLPLLQMEMFLESYSAWESSLGSMTTNPPPHIQSLLSSTKEAIEVRNKFENSISDSASDTAQLLADYVAYCGLEEKHGSENQVFCIYERALFAFPVTHSLWLRYGSYVEKKIKEYEAIVKVYKRAVRNCPWLGVLWERLLRASALYEAPLDEVEGIYTQALQAGLKGEEDYMVVILSWLDYLQCHYWRERTTKGEAHSFEYVRNAFQFADALMKKYFPKYVDPDHGLARYWSQLEITIGQDMEQARNIWETVLTNEKTAKSARAWIQYIQMENSEKHHGPARKLYHRAFHAIQDQAAKNNLAREWLRHEGMTGTPKQYANALNQVQHFIEEYNVTQLSKQNPKLASASQKKTTKMQDLTEQDVTALRRHKGKKDQAQSNASKFHEEPRRRFESKPISMESKPYEFFDDKNTLFVTRIASGTQDEQLRDMFQECGELSAIRHLRYPNDASKGRAYIVFKTEEGKRAGLAKNNAVLNGKKVLVQISKPTRMHQAPQERVEKTEKGLTNDDFRKLLR